MKLQRVQNQCYVPPYAIFCPIEATRDAYTLNSEQKYVCIIHGVGSAKLPAIAGFFLSIIADFCVQHGLKMK